jgi:hypothetical protein
MDGEMRENLLPDKAGGRGGNALRPREGPQHAGTDPRLLVR